LYSIRTCGGGGEVNFGLAPAADIAFGFYATIIDEDVETLGDVFGEGFGRRDPVRHACIVALCDQDGCFDEIGRGGGEEDCVDLGGLVGNPP